MRGGNARTKLDVAPEIEFVSNEVQVFEIVRLRRKMFLPVPFLQNFGRERVAVTPAFRIETRAGVAVPIPGATKAGAVFEDAHRHAELAQAIELIQARNAGADDDRVVGGVRGWWCGRLAGG